MKRKKIIIIGLFFVVLAVFCSALWVYYDFKRPLVSVVMSTYKRPGRLVKAIDSILRQTYSRFEFIIINDSPDDRKTRIILKRYAQYDNRIKVITNSVNKGLIYSLNAGLDMAKGKYIVRMDDDDISFPTRLEKQVAFMQEHPELAVAGSWVSPIGSDRPYPFQRETDPQMIKVNLYVGEAPISHPSAIIRRSFLEENNIRYDSEFKSAEDRQFWMDITIAGGLIGNIPEVLVQYRLHSENSTEYYLAQYANVEKFQKQTIKNFLGESFNENDHICVSIKKMVQENKKHQTLDQDKLEQKVKFMCFDGENVVYHKHWNDVFIFDKENRVCRRRAPSECGTILKKKDNVITLQWDKWGIETFEKQSDQAWHLKQD